MKTNHLAYLLENINTTAGTPVDASHFDATGNFVAYVGHYSADIVNPTGKKRMYLLVQNTSTGGTLSTPLGIKRYSKARFIEILEAFLRGLQTNRRSK